MQQVDNNKQLYSILLKEEETRKRKRSDKEDKEDDKRAKKRAKTVYVRKGGERSGCFKFHRNVARNALKCPPDLVETRKRKRSDEEAKEDDKSTV